MGDSESLNLNFVTLKHALQSSVLGFVVPLFGAEVEIAEISVTCLLKPSPPISFKFGGL